MQTKKSGFLMLESITGLMIAMIAVACLNEIIIKGHQTEQRLEKKVDYYLAQRIMRQNQLKQVMIHDHQYQNED